MGANEIVKCAEMRAAKWAYGTGWHIPSHTHTSLLWPENASPGARAPEPFKGSQKYRLL